LVAHYNRIGLEPNKDVIRIVQNLYESGIPLAQVTHIARENPLHSISIMWFKTGPPAKANVLHHTLRDIKINHP
jgi:hypothetical protein